MSLLTLDAGNTSLKGALWRGGEIADRFRLGVAEEPAAALVASLAEVTEVRVVASPGCRPHVPWLHVEPLWVGADLPVPGRVEYDRPEEMGDDRRLACFGAFHEVGAALVVNCGTCVTLTHVDAELRMRGLAITAGLACLERGIGAAAPALAAFQGGAMPAGGALPRGTADNLAVGKQRGWEGLVRALVADAGQRLARTGVAVGEVVFTGSDGDAARVAVGSGRFSADLVHRGLAELGRN